MVAHDEVVALLNDLRAPIVVTAELDGQKKTFEALARIDTPQEGEYYRNGGILPFVLRQLAAR